MLCVILLLRELFQMLVSFKRYIFNTENLVELAILGGTIYLMFGDDEDLMAKRHWAAFCVVCSWAEALVLVGRHPRLSAYVAMFTTVARTFLAFLAFYAIIIVAFAIAFYLMYHHDHAGTDPNEEYPFFDGGTCILLLHNIVQDPTPFPVLSSLFKTSAMFLGELEFGSIPWTPHPLSNLLFLSFLFLVVVVLMNLLNGLAVSDTGLIRQEAEIVGWRAMVDLITYAESTLLGMKLLYVELVYT